MNDPVISKTVADLFKGYPYMFITYHVMSSGYNLFTPIGALFDGAAHAIHGVRKGPTALQTMGSTGLIAGCAGMTLGLAALINAASKGDKASPPWTIEGRQQRVDGLSRNFKVRALDLGVWSGIVFATGTLFFFGGPQVVRLSPGALGVAQGISLGSAIGSLASVGFILLQTSKGSGET